MPQHDLFKRNQGELDRERGRDYEIKPIQRDRRDRDFENWERYVRDHDRDHSRDVRRSSRERHNENRRPQSSKHSKKVEKVSIPLSALRPSRSKLTHTSKQSGPQLWTRVTIARVAVATAKTVEIPYR